MPPSTERSTEEDIRRRPVWFARLANRIVGWTTDYCYAGCGRPVTGRLTYELERYGGIPIVTVLCSLDGPCMDLVMSNPVAPDGRSYADYRPDIINALDLSQDFVPDGGRIVLSYGR